MINAHVESNKLVVSEFYVFVVWPPPNVWLVTQQRTKDVNEVAHDFHTIISIFTWSKVA
jgi:hypothetical protein